MSAIAVWTWVGAVVLGVVVLGFGAYEVLWKVRRLGHDVERLQQLRVQLADLQESVVGAQATAIRVQEQRAVNAHRHGDALFPHPKDPHASDPRTREHA